MSVNPTVRAALLGGFVLTTILFSGCGYGPEQTVTIEISGVADASAKEQIQEKLKTMTDSSGHSMSTSSSGDSMTVKLAPVSDVAAFAKKIDFGKVTDTDVTGRVVKVSVGGESPAPEE